MGSNYLINKFLDAQYGGPVDRPSAGQVAAGTTRPNLASSYLGNAASTLNIIISDDKGGMLGQTTLDLLHQYTTNEIHIARGTKGLEQ